MPTWDNPAPGIRGPKGILNVSFLTYWYFLTVRYEHGLPLSTINPLEGEGGYSTAYSAPLQPSSHTW